MISQIKKFKLFNFLLLSTLGLFITSCDQAQLVDVDSFTDSSIEKIQAKAFGKAACLELIFPVTISFVDESTAEVTSYENLYETVVAFFEETGLDLSKENIPDLVFPVQVLNEEGEIIDVASIDELKELKKECPRSGKSKGRKGKGFKCFSLVFPVSLTIDETEVTFDSKDELKEAIKALKEELGSDFERPTLVYPVTVEYDDETQVTVESVEELQALKEACSEE